MFWQKVLFVPFELVNLVPAGMVVNVNVVAGHVKAANDGEAPLAAPVEIYAVLATLDGFG
ncbi:hypothetical protein [Klebsiella phage ABTNL-2]|uniref:Uncharacterized protein n=1 Tax=Klebsiella phage ABTNL-2 TaxID=2849097 RepID=A0A8F2F4E9_9CAUD|nr:hypothetical protein [Klebsiella phage ABTNL-2]